jgi:hypothetical protein
LFYKEKEWRREGFERSQALQINKLLTRKTTESIDSPGVPGFASGFAGGQLGTSDQVERYT